LPHRYSAFYRKQFLENILPFWEKNSIDIENGGFFSCLDQEGNVYDTDKFVWLQARQVWTFSMLYNKVEKNSKWLEIASHGIAFLKKYGRDTNGNFYFSLTKEGQPLIQAYNIYADCFAAAAFSAYGQASGDEESISIAKHTYNLFLSRRNSPKGVYDKSTGVRLMQSFGLPMMTAWLTCELDWLVPKETQLEVFENCIHKILDVHYNPQNGLLHEYVSVNGEILDTYDGRLINPGHGIEAMWFLMDIAVKVNNPSLITKATDICLQILEYGWDKEHGGIFYFLDAKGVPLQQLEWDQKLWWVHQEALIALSRAYMHTRRKDVIDWYDKVHEYSWKHFPDISNGEWYGYLKREGQPLNTSKGGKWKGCFHSPRAMYECWKNFQNIPV
jgi:N-acylglucosamine 2-epimerase